jgi:hypothetical protein
MASAPPIRTIPLPQPPKSDAELLAWARRLMIALPIALANTPTPITGGPAPTVPWPLYTITNRTTDRVIDANSTTINEFADVLGTVIRDEIDIGTLTGYTYSNAGTDRSYDANSTTLDELADILGTVVADLIAGNTANPYTVSNISVDRSYDADSTSLNELADVLGSFITDCQSRGLLG